MKTIGICCRCRKQVLDIDDYFRLEEFLNGKLNKGYLYHRKCFQDRIKTSKMKDILFGRTMQLLTKAEEHMA